MDIEPSLYADARALAQEATKSIEKAIKILDLIVAQTHNHGGQLHVPSWQCADCSAERRAWLETNHPNWKVEANERGCCGLCYQRGYKFFKGKE